MKIAIATDHNGVNEKKKIMELLPEIEWVDKSPNNYDTDDYPDFAFAVCEAINNKEVDLGVLMCGTGIGMSIAANRHKGIRCALCSEPFSAKMSREHNDSNVLALGGRIIGKQMAEEIIKTWIYTEFTGGRHISRIEKLEV